MCVYYFYIYIYLSYLSILSNVSILSNSSTNVSVIPSVSVRPLCLTKVCLKKISNRQNIPGAEIGSDHDSSMMIFRTRRKQVSKAIQTWFRCGLTQLW